MPYLLLWEQFLPEGSMWPGDVFGVEPMSARGRSMEDAYTYGDLRSIAPGGRLDSWMELTATRL